MKNLKVVVAYNGVQLCAGISVGKVTSKMYSTTDYMMNILNTLDYFIYYHAFFNYMNVLLLWFITLLKVIRLSNTN